ncbi:hypothetical protein ADL12_19455 [Streptomyces regalis]|uniref:HTH araC/xylS-type domain-containing protein n=1 Tax=Streptomyces regalis TaxID=68262 RepID=A0A0X3UUJ1_9ACTN|nr:hypothetical protein ADL12_19455 [Streptomyces regalis]
MADVAHAGAVPPEREARGGRTETFGSGDLRAYDDREGGLLTVVGVEIRKALLPVLPHQELLGRRLTGREGIGALLTDLRETEGALPPETRQGALTARIQAFIQQNLHDPNLTPPVVAAAHHISLSYLHRLFQERAQGGDSRGLHPPPTAGGRPP